MFDAKSMSSAIRMKRKKLKSDGVENMIDTAPGPQMNPQDIYNQKMDAQVEDTLGSPAKSMAPSDPADASVDGSSQDLMALKKKMARIERILGTLKVG